MNYNSVSFVQTEVKVKKHKAHIKNDGKIIIAEYQNPDHPHNETLVF